MLADYLETIMSDFEDYIGFSTFFLLIGRVRPEKMLNCLCNGNNGVKKLSFLVYALNLFIEFT